VSLVNLGELATEQGNYAEAEAYLHEGVEIARQLGRPWLLCGALHARGDLALKRQEIEQAEGAFRELGEIASQDNQEYRAVALYGLARVALAHQDLREAQELGQESLRLLEVIGNRRAPEVRGWLQTLP
jgi:tetratricopeptide (TPR) repeat protein